MRKIVLSKQDKIKVNTEHETLETRNLKFNRRNVEKIAHDYDAAIIRFDTEIESATLKDNRGRILFVQGRNW